MIDILKTISEKPITFAEAKSILEAKEAQLHENDKELGHEQKITLEYLRTISVLDQKIAEDTAKELIEAVPILKDHQIMMLVNVLPDCEDDVDIIFAKERVKLDKDQTKKIAEIIKKIKPKKVIKKTVKEKKVEDAAVSEKTVDIKSEKVATEDAEEDK
ncbi:MAG: hypothetical protein GQ477_06135 [Nanohaloarchaea archaeon]|nr:hypothetical protein [Candidatus Nanohaloarchaea archaeon]